MNILLIEDEALAARKLRALIRAHNPAYRVLDTLDSVAEAVTWLQQEPSPDLIFLDVHLADGSGFDIFERVTVQAPIVFTTAYDQYALRAFELNSVHYVLKPVTQDSIDRSFAKLAALQRSPPDAAPRDYAALTALLRQAADTAYKTRFLVKSGTRIRSVPAAEVAYCYAEQGLTFLMTLSRERYAIDYTLEELEAKLDPAHFFRLNRRVLAQWPAIQEVHPYFKGRLSVVLTPAGAGEVVVSSDTTPAFKRWMDR